MRPVRSALSLLALAGHIHGQTLPYNPTQLALVTNHSALYMLHPVAGSPNQAQLSTLELNGILSSSSLQDLVVAQDPLPFLQQDEQIPYTAVVQADGSVTVVTGNCTAGAEGLEVWTHASYWERGTRDGPWSKATASGLAGVDTTDMGPGFLSSGIAFSRLAYGSDDTTTIYTFGGMCPSASSTASTWQSAANYSNSMLVVSPNAAKQDESLVYRLSFLDNRGPPIPQAGVSITPLSPTYALSTSGAPQTQQQDFVLLGGHTQNAFINMSQVAVFSLPQQSWSFMPVNQPTEGKSGLARRQSTGVTPRSGHTAILSDSGDSIILYGGWVGDVNTPATPQLAVLELGDGYGGSGDWQWTIPRQSGQAPPQAGGIYGHGAVMLPGGVMMVAGGYEISASTSKRARRSTQATNTKIFFYNVTSSTWLQSYTVPQDAFQQSSSSSSTSTKSEKVGLGAGLGVGAALLVSVVGVYFYYRKRVKQTQEDRERALLTHSSDGSSIGPMQQPFLKPGGIDGRGGDAVALGRFWRTNDQPEDAYPRPPPMQHTTGVWTNVPSPTRGLRRGVAAKNYQYHAAPRFDDKRASSIHPIAEHENEDEVISLKSDREQLDDAEAKLKELQRVLNPDDPFLDDEPNPLGSHPVSPELNGEETMRRVPTMQSRMSVPARKPVPVRDDEPNWTVEPGVDEQDGRSSPSRSDDRTSSTLSDRSQLSNSSITRTMSTRTGALLAAAMAAQRRGAGTDQPPATERTQTMSTDASFTRTRARSGTNGSITPGAVNEAELGAFTTSKRGFPQLQSEGEALLGGRPDVDDPYRRAMAAVHPSGTNTVAPSYSRGPPPAPAVRRQGWMGSLKRALNVVALGDRSFSLTSSAERYRDDPRSAASSPTKDRKAQIGSAPRRAVSDGGALLRQKRGQQDWDEKVWPPYKDDPDDWGEPKPPVEEKLLEDDWDVEGAANRRDFQVMFTVPKSRLRVVNDDMDRASLRSASDSIVSRNGSLKDIKREASVKTLRARFENETLGRLPATAEESSDEKEKAA